MLFLGKNIQIASVLQVQGRAGARRFQSASPEVTT